MVSGEILESATLSWEHTLVISQFELKGIFHSWILNDDGSQLVIRKPTREIVCEFAADMGVLDYEMHVLAELNDFTHGIPCVSGEYQLVPLRNKRSVNVTWVMAHHVATYGICATDKLLTIVFNNGPLIKVDVAASKYISNRERSLNIGAMQVSEDRQYDISHGTTSDVKPQWGVANLDESGHHTDEHNKLRVVIAKRTAELHIYHNLIFGENLPQADVDRCIKAIMRPFRG